MKAKVRSKREELRADYAKINGHPFTHFYCPILFKDEDVQLCEGHIINTAFPNSSRAWTVQRSDVDNFYGSNFESDFIAIKYHNENLSPGKVIADKKLSKTFDPKFLVDNKPVDHFVLQGNKGNIPEQFTPIELQSDGRSVLLGLKMRPEDVFALVGHKWDIEIFKDVRIPALVSLIKAAHLTLFELLGYRYACFHNGRFIGYDILGKFFSQNHDSHKPEVLKNAHCFFREFVHMVRPVQAHSSDLRGTITDRLVLICWGSSGEPWALIVFIRTSQQLHAVMIPNKVVTFINFLRSETEEIKVSYCRLEQDHWAGNKEKASIIWPKRDVLYPR